MSAPSSRVKRKIIFPHRHAVKVQDKIQSKTESSSNLENNQLNPVSIKMEDDRTPATGTIPSYLLHSPLLQNPTFTRTSALQADTISECLPLLNGLNNSNLRDFSPLDFRSDGVLELQVENHVYFLEDALADYPAPFVGVDASRPWIIYWALLSLHFLNQDISVYKDRVIKTFMPLQNTTGGFGGGEGHLSHLAGTYATLLSLALVGGQTAWALTKRKEMWQWLGRLKQADGGFRMTENGEEDVRGAYCAMIAITLLDLPSELPPDAPARLSGLTSFQDGLGEYLSRCQTYEGGISGAPGNEAHGAYAFCTIACLCLLGQPHQVLNQYLDLDALVNWLSSRQYAPEGGFAGRTNKVVDGCYSHWLGGCWPLVLAALNGPKSSAQEADIPNLYSTEGLARYILNCCQNSGGGLRDKPSKQPDAYHSCYTLAGISTTEHYHYYTESDGAADQFDASFTWQVAHNQERQVQRPQHKSEIHVKPFDAGCRLKAVHPVFVIPHNAVLNMRSWAVQQKKVN